MRRATVFSLLSLCLLPARLEARAKNADLYTLYDVTRNAQLVVTGTVDAIDHPRQVVTLRIDKVWHGAPADPATVRYEVRGSLDPFRVGRRVLEFLDPNLPYGTQDPKTIMAPLKPRSPRNRVQLDDAASAGYAAFAMRYLELTASDRGARWSPACQEHLVASLASPDDHVRAAAGECLNDLLTLSDRGGKLARELLDEKDRPTLAAVLTKAESGPGVPIMKLAMILDEPALAAGMVHGSLYIPQSGIEAKDSVRKALDLAKAPAEKALRAEYSGASTDGYREQLISVMSAVGGAPGESFLWELVGKEPKDILRKEAMLAHACLPDAGLWPKIEGLYGKLPEVEQAELFGRIAACRQEPAIEAFVRREVANSRPTVRHAAAFEGARRRMAEAQPILEAILSGCGREDTVSLACLSALDGLRNLQTPDSIASLEKAAAREDASAAFREDALRFLEDIRRPASGS